MKKLFFGFIFLFNNCYMMYDIIAYNNVYIQDQNRNLKKIIAMTKINLQRITFKTRFIMLPGILTRMAIQSNYLFELPEDVEKELQENFIINEDGKLNYPKIILEILRDEKFVNGLVNIQN
ncbi:hypothetical protein M1446_04030 [Candidatus Dependentiae bacterium]|nr:hypothetical protein [Candidatus Dependentiae bacterium]